MIIRDNSIIHKSDLLECMDLVTSIENKTLYQLEKEGIFLLPETTAKSDDLSRNQMVLQLVNNSYRSQNILGYICNGKQDLIITSRFSNGEQDFLFQYLLTKVLQFPNIVEYQTSANPDQRLFEFYLFLFPKYLLAALKKGIFKSYKQFNYNDSKVNGMLNISRHIKENTPFIGKISYMKSEFTYNNFLTQLIRHTIEFIKGKSNGRLILGKIPTLVRDITRITPNYQESKRRRVILENLKTPINHAYYREYLQLQKLCLLILRQDKFQFGNGDQKVYGLLFDAAWLWEEYLATLLDEKFFHPQNKVKNGMQKLFTDDLDKKIGIVYPDFISKSNYPRIIIDAKYKPEENIGNKDYLQLLAYLFRFQSETGYYIYPEVNRGNNKSYKLNQGITYENNVRSRDDIKIIKYAFNIPYDAKTYDEFVIDMEKNEKLLKSQILMGDKNVERKFKI